MVARHISSSEWIIVDVCRTPYQLRASDGLRRIVGRSACFDQRLHSHEVAIEAALRVRTKYRGDCVADPTPRRVVRQTDVDTSLPIGRRLEANEASVRDR